jgi:hypothetical protein
MRRDRIYLAAMIILLATSLASSIAAIHYYTQWSQRPPEPRGSLSDDGSTNMFSNSNFWDQWSILTKILSSNYTLPGQL